jgi:hypothetical protein
MELVKPALPDHPPGPVPPPSEPAPPVPALQAPDPSGGEVQDSTEAGVAEAKDPGTDEDESTLVKGTFVLPADVPSFAGQMVEIRLYKIHPLLADAPADLVDMVQMKDYSHTEGEPSETKFTIGGNEPLDASLKYYVTLFILKDGKRTHMGKAPGKFLCNVLTQGEPREVSMTVRPVGR